MRTWSPEHPHLYDIECAVQFDSVPSRTDKVLLTAAFREVLVEGRRLKLNGKDLRIRGVLNWGYAPPRNAPSIDEAHFRRELELIRSLGFNAMKFCLWVPPQRYLELCDEMGVLAWMEYPTWHSRWTEDQHPTLRREFAEFFAYDRNHPSVVLRSLTCETGSQADLGVIRSLYEQCHNMVPSGTYRRPSTTGPSRSRWKTRVRSTLRQGIAPIARCASRFHRWRQCVPTDWPSSEAYLVFHGVDDYYDVFVNGKRVGGGGDIENRATAFEERASHAIGRVRGGDRLQVTIRVYDWYGAGGVFRPVWLSTTPYRPRRILK